MDLGPTKSLLDNLYDLNIQHTQPINTCTVPKVGWVDLSNDQRGVIPGWGRQSSKDTEHHHNNRLFMYHIEQEHRESGCYKTERCGDTKTNSTHMHTHSFLERDSNNTYFMNN